MNLADEVYNAFGVLTDEKQIPNNTFGFILRTAFDVILKQKKEEELLRNEEVQKLDPVQLKQLFSASVCLVLEAAKVDADASILKNKLEEYQKSSSRVDYFCRIFTEKKGLIRKLLSTSTFHFPQIVDVDWRFDYCIKSNALEKIDTPLFLISLKAEDMRKNDKERAQQGRQGEDGEDNSSEKKTI
eukprot:TRINITY_DN729_c1_g1_i1.p1 TRINITY_DN729_c1_g1~~TRINITY_DN729_c1_g1_i1.p1  ORF type:complete len:200 (+),score=68.05 TRINITY_DN729_c1_g1_i1:45-602(+)